MILNDFTMLGRTEPAKSKTHGDVVCSAGYSRELRELIRIYPLPVNYDFKTWKIANVDVRRNNRDSRKESWRLNNEEPGKAINQRGMAKKDDEFGFLKSLSVNGIDELNKNKLSLGIIQPGNLSGYFRQREGVDPYLQDSIFDKVSDPMGRSDNVPIMSFYDKDVNGNVKFHNLQLKEWGCSILLNKYKKEPDVLWDALNIKNNNYEHLLFVGNQNSVRSSWLIIKIISRKVQLQNDIFDI